MPLSVKKCTNRFWKSVNFFPRVTLSEATMAEKATKAMVTSARIVSGRVRAPILPPLYSLDGMKVEGAATTMFASSMAWSRRASTRTLDMPEREPRTPTIAEKPASATLISASKKSKSVSINALCPQPTMGDSSIPQFRLRLNCHKRRAR